MDEKFRPRKINHALPVNEIVNSMIMHEALYFISSNTQIRNFQFRLLVHVPNFGGCQGRSTKVGVTTVSNSLILGGRVTKVLKNGNEKWGGGVWKGG